ncbi:hypothetical protein DFQ27_006857 [Actinomortierella ambigua]|uniref:Tetraspanin n=1 Tax=Actinomortierella ambigua TaxID=1343610 RepID=A0A9P6PX72_9FUNG|nr:hypothetical protein DFQ27_006857 [Actinomortierella ambigua]
MILLSVGTFIYFAPAAVFVSSTLLPHVVLVLGATISLMSFLGYYGAINERRWVLWIFLLVLLIAIALQITAGIVAFIYRNQGTEVLDNAWSRVYRSDPRVVQDLEAFFQCCGFNHIADRAIPATCALDFHFYQGCRDNIQTAFQDSLQAIGVIGAILGGIEMVSLIGAGLLFQRLNRGSSYTNRRDNNNDGGQEALMEALLEANRLNQQIDNAYRQRERQRQDRYAALAAQVNNTSRHLAQQLQREGSGTDAGSGSGAPLLHQPQPLGPPPSYGSILNNK